MWIKFSKLFYVLLVIYYAWFQVVFFQVPNMLLILGVCTMGFIILHALQTRTNILKSLTTELKLWILFTFTSFAFGLLVAVNQGYLISSITTFSQFLVLIFGIVYISNQDQNIDFFIKVFITFTIICAITTVFWGVNYGRGQISMGLNNNPNELGITMAIGVCCILYKLSFKKLIYSMVAFSAILLLIYVTLLTGSRKSFFSVVLIMIYWFTFVAFKDIKALRFTQKIKGVFAILLMIGASYCILYPFFKDSILLGRLINLFESGSETRVGMYSVGIDLFKQSPLVGIGFNNYRAASIYGTYSHSTYAEALACTGMVGSILYFFPYIIILINYVKMVTSRKLDALLLKQARVMLGLFGVLLFLGFSVIHFYSTTSSIAFGMLIAFYNVNMKTLKDGVVKPHTSNQRRKYDIRMEN